ncbi:FRG domain-containing protein [Wielerella bovis]|uniref:FRG domain-containing protein n=1 Tax=Wielerella bovis TaxID=2917790 RepID=UPI0020184C11|nr:FRG domain-containing protein [Wielerella bovis]MCG7657536.1 FRG domain-containing protein [Wielerella bovis]MCG7659757.1 FRG domain-containing protein [Wielerella bovis]
MNNEEISTNYFEEIPEWESGEPIFVSKNDEINSRIPLLRVNSWKKFIDLLSTNFFRENISELIFRGQRRYDWGLMPNIARNSDNGLFTEELMENQLSNFKKAIRGRIKDYTLLLNEDDDEIWAIGQHYGLNTPLLDWTYSPYVSLFFAFSRKDVKAEKPNEYRVVYIANKSLLDDFVTFIDPKIDMYGRLVNQAGLFIKAKPNKSIESLIVDSISGQKEIDFLSNEDFEQEIAKYLCKIYILNTPDIQNDCILSLRQMNIHHANLFPDLMGAADYCNLLSEFQPENKSPKPTESSTSNNGNFSTPNIESLTNSGSFDNSIKQVLSLYPAIPKEELDELTSKLQNILQTNMVIDWKTRADIQAKIKIAWRRVLYQTKVDKAQIDKILDKLFELDFQ